VTVALGDSQEMRAWPRRLHHSAWWLAIIALGAAFSLLPLARGEWFFYWDNAKQHYAQSKFLHDALRAGSLPQWWPAAGMGFPVTAEGQAAHYSPIRVLLAFLFDPGPALMWEVAVYLVLAGLGTYAFIRQVGGSRPAATLAGITQMFGSFSVIFVRNLALHRAMCLFPLTMLMAERFVSRRRLRDLAAAAVLIALQFLSGHPTLAIVASVASTTYVIVRTLQRETGSRVRRGSVVSRLVVVLAGWTAALALGVTSAGVQTIPTLMHVENSLRQGGWTFNYAVRRALPATPAGLGMLWLPHAYRQGDWLDDRASSGPDVNTVPNSGIYAGAIAALLAVVAVWGRRRTAPAIALAFCGITATLLALGGRAPLFPALWMLPGMQGIRYPHRFLLWSLFCVAALAGLGLDRARAYARRGRSRGTLSCAMWTVVLGVSGLGAAAWWRAPDRRFGLALSAALIAVAFALVAMLVRVPRRGRAWIVSLILVFAVGDLLLFRRSGNYAAVVPAAQAMAPPPVVQYLRSQKGEFRVMSLVPLEAGWARNDELRDLVQPDLCTVWGVDSVDFYASLLLKRQFIVRESLVSELRARPESAEKLAPFLGVLNVGYVISPRDVTLKGWDRAFETPLSIVWKNRRVRPRYFVAGSALSEDLTVHPEWVARSRERLETYARMVRNWPNRIGEAQIIDKLLAEPVDFASQMILSEVPPLPGAIDERTTVRRLTRESDAMAFEVVSPTPVVLYVSESFYPGWRVRVNGAEGRVLRANWLGMAVSLESGRSYVELRYSTPGFGAGATASGASLLLITVVWIWGGNRTSAIERSGRR
jgi:hypothetical protein